MISRKSFPKEYFGEIKAHGNTTRRNPDNDFYDASKKHIGQIRELVLLGTNLRLSRDEFHWAGRPKMQVWCSSRDSSLNPQRLQLADVLCDVILFSRIRLKMHLQQIKKNIQEIFFISLTFDKISLTTLCLLVAPSVSLDYETMDLWTLLITTFVGQLSIYSSFCLTRDVSKRKILQERNDFSEQFYFIILQASQCEFFWDIKAL